MRVLAATCSRASRSGTLVQAVEHPEERGPSRLVGPVPEGEPAAIALRPGAMRPSPRSSRPASAACSMASCTASRRRSSRGAWASAPPPPALMSRTCSASSACTRGSRPWHSRWSTAWSRWRMRRPEQGASRQVEAHLNGRPPPGAVGDRRPPAVQHGEAAHQVEAHPYPVPPVPSWWNSSNTASFASPGIPGPSSSTVSVSPGRRIVTRTRTMPSERTVAAGRWRGRSQGSLTQPGSTCTIGTPARRASTAA